MTRGKSKMGLGTLLLAGAAVFAYSKYSKMSEQEKKNLLGGLKDKGRKFYEDNLSGLMGKSSNGHLSNAYNSNTYQS
jgi:hypothetical protein